MAILCYRFTVLSQGFLEQLSEVRMASYFQPTRHINVAILRHV